MGKQVKGSVNKYGISKTINCNRGGKTAEQVHQILLLEVQEHIRNNPDVVFDKITDPVPNSFGGQVYHITFKNKIGAAIS